MNKTRFDICLEQVLQHEGGYADHPSDPGGATNLGITRKTLARWRKVSPWWALSKANVKALGKPEAARIYRAHYWDSTRAASLPPGLDLALFDFAVNSGPDRAIRTLQAAVGVKADGRIGPLTLDAVRQRARSQGIGPLIEAYCARRLGFLRVLKTFPVFGKGWTARVDAVLTAALAEAGASHSTNSATNIWGTAMNVLNGYKTYIIAFIMLLAGLAQVLGIELPALDGNSAGHLMMEALAVLFLRKGLKTEIGSA